MHREPGAILRIFAPSQPCVRRAWNPQAESLALGQEATIATIAPPKSAGAGTQMEADQEGALRILSFTSFLETFP